MEFIYTLFENYGVWVLLIITFTAQLGLPIGSSFFIMWYGSTLDSLSALATPILAVASAAIVGDMLAFYFGQRFSNQLAKAEKKYSWLKKRIEHSKKLLDNYGAWIIWITRFLATGLGPIVNYLLGSRNYPALQFLRWVIVGELLFAAEMLYFGFYFKETWEDLLAIIADAGWLIVLIMVFIWIVRKIIKNGQRRKEPT